MRSTDVALRTENLRRLQMIYPGAVGWGEIQGSQHLVRRQLRLWERRGEVVPIRRFEKVDRRMGTTWIPYVRMKERSQIRREQSIRIGVLSGAGLAFLAVVLWLAWESRYVIISAAGMIALVTLGVRFLLHWSRGCPGLHCGCCPG